MNALQKNNDFSSSSTGYTKGIVEETVTHLRRKTPEVAK